MDTRPTASIIIIGDEILKGEVQDTNSYFLCQELHKCGIHVPRISSISDDIDDISEEVLNHSKRYTYVITTGGIGPTHDDITYEGIAKAFSEKLVLNEELEKDVCLKLDLSPSDAGRMFYIPQTAQIHHNSFYPIVSVRNVFIFPGIPSYLRRSFNKLKSIFCVDSEPYFNRYLYVNVSEFGIIDVLNAAAKEFDSRVKLGSYPELNNVYFKVKLALESDSEVSLTEAESYLRSHLPPNSIVIQRPPNSEDAQKLMCNVLHKNVPPFDKVFYKTLEKSIKILEECFDKYSVQGTCLSFNGGKDCTVLLHLTFLFLAYKGIENRKLKVLYVHTSQTFPEIEEFVKHCISRYNLEVFSYNKSIKEALSTLKIECPTIEAVLMGSRLSDPHCSGLQPFQKTDHDWPQIMRVHPLAHWSYTEVWKFLRELEVPYCGLYDMGYTSLGCLHNTFPNEELLTTTKDGISYYLPAYLLQNPTQERRGRSEKNSD